MAQKDKRVTAWQIKQIMNFMHFNTAAWSKRAGTAGAAGAAVEQN
jgi:hypothetical protein